ncbi:Putative integral membrane protein [Paucilactobacillus oligofermentans DSM 15707 = LMG 22743]|nr:threonine/serine exporter family protein [Paucilactobacillus oligofermentans]CUS25774.1 Putative integral membrane protein [Paucilactobacillus oligofermentans DSM 15707 = LMG 22743]
MILDNMIFQLIMAYIATICFGIILNIPHQAFNVAGLIGAGSWGIYLAMSHLGVGIAFGNLVAAFLISVASLYAAKYKKMPMMIFNIPSLVSFVPGGQSYQMVRNFAIGNTQTAWSFCAQVIVIAGALAMGFVLGELYHKFSLYFRTNFLRKI